MTFYKTTEDATQPKCGFTSILTAFNTVTTNLQEMNKAEKDE